MVYCYAALGIGIQDNQGSVVGDGWLLRSSGPIYQQQMPKTLHNSFYPAPLVAPREQAFGDRRANCEVKFICIVKCGRACDQFPQRWDLQRAGTRLPPATS